MIPLYTIGYEGSSIHQFVDALLDHGIEHVLDVRRLPLSRKPGFAKKALIAHCEAANIAYTHLVDLGTPTDLRKRLKEEGDYPVFFECYRTYLAAQDDVLQVAETFALARPSVLVCFERDHHTCHRLEVGNKLLQRNPSLQIVHLQVGQPLLQEATYRG